MREETKDCSGATVSRAHAAVKLVTRHSSRFTTLCQTSRLPDRHTSLASLL